MEYSIFDFSDLSKIKVHGRCSNDSGRLSVAWSNSGFEFNFTGSGFVVSFGEFRDIDPAYLRVFVDGTSARYALADGSEKICIDGLDEKEHNAKILRVTEGLTSITVKQVAVCGNSPALLTPPAPKALKIEFYGDSITCGYGVLGARTTPGFAIYEEDSTKAYAYMTAENLDADGRYMCKSGKGIAANCLGDRSDIKISDFWAWENTAGKLYDTSLWTPDICVLNCGTNDAWGGITDSEFIEKGVEFLGNIRKAYPNAKILWTFGMMDETKQKAAKQAVDIFSEKDKNVYFHPISSFYHFSEEMGGGGHPSILTSKRASALLTEKIKEIMGM